jgi:hypothetical protein
MEDVRVKFLERIGEDTFIIRCAFCEGKGRKPTKMGPDVPNKPGYTYPWRIRSWDGKAPCPMCGGKGVLWVKSPDIPIYDARCKGTGHEPDKDGDASTDLCKTCMGTGVRSLTGRLKVLKSSPRVGSSTRKAGIPMRGIVWPTFCLVLSAIVAVFFAPPIAWRLGWPDWVTFIVVLLDVAFVMYLPLTIHEYYASFRILRGPMPGAAGVSCLGLLLLTLIFVIAPVIVFIWLILPLLGIPVTLPILK